MSKNQKRIQLTLGLLVGMFILGGILLNIAIGEEEVHNIDINGNMRTDVVVTLTTDIEIDRNVHPDAQPEDLVTFSAPPPAWNVAEDFSHGSGSISVSGTRIDDEGNEIGSVSVTGGIDVTVNFETLTVTSYYWAYASSNVSGDNQDWVNGNAWVQVPGKQKSYWAYYAWDINTFSETIPEFFANIKNKSMAAEAFLTTQGAKILVAFEAEGQ